jgi:glutamyl-tRNA synthetase
MNEFVQPGQQSRITNILDIPKLAPYLFVEPDYGSREAELMIKAIPQVEIGTAYLTWSETLTDFGAPF